MNPPPTVHDPELWLKHCCEARALARTIIDGEIGVIEGSRQMVVYGDRLHASDAEEFRIFRGIDSESDHLPIGHARQHWSASALKEKDAEIKGMEGFYRTQVIEAAMKILEKYK